MQAQFLATGIGSLPHLDAKKACRFILDTFKHDIVFWPQLVKRSFYENMFVQSSKGMPCVVIDSENKKIYINTASDNFEQELESCFGHYLENDIEFFLMEEEYALGFYTILSLLKGDLKIFKGQIIGPISFGLTVTDQNKQAIIYNKDLTELLVKALAIKVRWQIKKIRSHLPNSEIVIFIDEPYLVSIGSSYIPIKKELIINSINELIGSIHQEGSLAGIHCCGNTDWGVVLKTNLDILSFDAYEFLDNLLLYPQELSSFLDRGGVLSWGIVPTSNFTQAKATLTDLSSIVKKVGKEKNILKNRILITPSCGCGLLDLDTAEKIHILAAEFAHQLQTD